MTRTIIAVVFCLLSFTSNAEEWTSKVSRVIDGDTFQLSRPLVRIRLCGVDTPEKGQRGYREATQYTKALVAGKTVQCRTVGEGTPCDGRSRKKSYDRFVAQCFVDGNDIAMELVEAGHACAWPKYSGQHYFKSGRCIK
ncbi:thermonuclease family protein [Labrenzia sp. OB1]|uniref:thermonuclease family protein n=1 Tax=Labrenzia sp. OB1 TaxID=1561204 RepID=UPI0018FEBA97|nr:thermonuclease family protein [Labrenzia sp. OB1]